MSCRKLCLSATMLKKWTSDDKLVTRQKRDQGTSRHKRSYVRYVVCEKSRLLVGIQHGRGGSR